MNITQLLLASSIPANNNEVLNNDTLIYFGALIGFIWGILMLATHYIFKKWKQKKPEELPIEITI